MRNSGAVAVVEGVGAHGCEYMTGGVVVVLGKTGANFGAGMTNGVAYVLDEDALFLARCNTDLVSVEDLGSEDDAALMPLLVAHAERTGSAIARTILSGWPGARSAFRRVAPKAAPAVRRPPRLMRRQRRTRNRLWPGPRRLGVNQSAAGLRTTLNAFAPPDGQPEEIMSRIQARPTTRTAFPRSSGRDSGRRGFPFTGEGGALARDEAATSRFPGRAPSQSSGVRPPHVPGAASGLRPQLKGTKPQAS